VAKFRVELHRRARQDYSGMPDPNPFLRPMPSDSARVNMSVRAWEFEADDEAHVRKLLQEAYDSDVPGVDGYTLRSIERLPGSQRESSDAV
jgi:hypothetical protein